MRHVLILLFCIGFTACGSVPTPETSREKYAAAEATYKAVVTTIDQLATARIIRNGTPTAQTVASSLKITRAALDAWGVSPESVPRQQAALVALQALQRQLVELQRRRP